MKEFSKPLTQGNLMIKQGRLYTKNLVPGITVYDELLINKNGIEYREWNPKRSKLGAGIKKGIKNPVNEKTNVLYLGAASGTTVSHVSDLSPEGRIYAVEFAPEPMKKLVMLSKKRQNIIPIFADANNPNEYEGLVEGKADVVFQDIAQRNQVEIFTINCKEFLKKNGIGMLALKARSIDVTKNPINVFKKVELDLEKNFKIIDFAKLEPFEKDHKLYVVQMK